MTKVANVEMRQQYVCASRCEYLTGDVAMYRCVCVRMWMKIKKEMDTKYKQNVDNNKWQTHMCKWMSVVLCCACPLHITSIVIHWYVGKILHSFSRFACKILCICCWNGCEFEFNPVIIQRMMFWYYKLLALHPNWIAFIVFTLSSACIFVSLTVKEVPDFTDPALVCRRFNVFLSTHLFLKNESVIYFSDFIRGLNRVERKYRIV